ncbi:hypothetical protein CRG98_022318 [Punica granatum]|uniref:Uncharacterized protein n=1 Tax=Punica granatum TaxID=22663 RepID=A0A2I0JLY5_PUNGR|nr:hypothetical protein CRG98_022318 [Punica granatum]
MWTLVLDCAAWECSPSRGCVTDTCEKESPLIILRPEGRRPISYPGLGSVFGGSCYVRAYCAHPNFISSVARMREAYVTRLGSVHLLGNARRTHVRRSRHLPFYDPKVEGRQVTWA